MNRAQHVLADTLGSVGVIISTLLINRYGWTGFDPLASIFIAVMIFVSVVQLVIDSGRLLVLDMGEEKEAEVRKALTALGRVEGVASYTKPRFWQKDPSSMVGSICIQLAPASGSAYDAHGRPTQFQVSIDRVTARVRRVLRSHIAGLDDLTVQVEPAGGLG
ncbi:Putative zinc transporter msc2 [Rhodotorula toruloides]